MSSKKIPGGQYTNLLFQSKQLGLTGRWNDIKQAYEQANILLGDIPKVTPSSKVVGDLAQFMVSQNLTPEQVTKDADKLAFPDSVVSYLRGEIGIPPGGFPEPFRTTVLKSRGLEPLEGRPGAFLADYDFQTAKDELQNSYKSVISDQDVLSYALYPQVFEGWKEYEDLFGDVSGLPTNLFLYPMKAGEEVELVSGFGRNILIKLVSITDKGNAKDENSGTKVVTFEVNGEQCFVYVTDKEARAKSGERMKAGAPGTVGAPMSGVVVSVKVKLGDKVKKGEPVATLSAMKMETTIVSSFTGVVDNLLVNVGDQVEGDDLLLTIK